MGSDLNQGTTHAQNQMLSFAQLATSSRVLDPVIQKMGLDTTTTALARDIDIVTPNDTLILEVRATAASPDKAAALANAVAASLSTVVNDLSPSTSAGSPSISVSLVDKAVPLEFQTSSVATGHDPGCPRCGRHGSHRGACSTAASPPKLSFGAVDAPTLGSVTRVPGAERGPHRDP